MTIRSTAPRASGESLAAFAQCRGVGIKREYWWNRLSRRSPTASRTCREALADPLHNALDRVLWHCMRVAEASLSDWERRVIEILIDVEVPGAPPPESLRESLPYLVVTGRCGCGCPSIFVRDVRHARKDDGCFHYSNAVTPDGRFGMFLLLRDDRPYSLDVQLRLHISADSPEERPDPESLIVSSA